MTAHQELTNQRREPKPPQASSGSRGRPISDILERIEARDGATSTILSLSSSAMRAGSLIREIRLKTGLSPKAFAEKVNLTQERLSAIERGNTPDILTFELFERIVRAFGHSAEVIPSS